MNLLQEPISINQFEELFKSEYEKLCAVANQYLADLDAAEETVQAVFVKFWEGRMAIEVKQSFAAYLYTSVRNNCLNQLKHLKIKEAYKEHNKREMEYEESRNEVDSSADELTEKIKSAIDKLPEGRKRIFILSRYEGLKYKEIAEKLNLSIKTVENQMGSALKFLKSELAEYAISLLLFIFFLIR